MKRKKLMILLLTLAMLLTSVACGQSAQDSGGKQNSVFPGTSDADSVVLDITTEPVEMNSILAYDSIAMSILEHCVSGITRLNEKDEPVADMAEKWEISDDNREYTIYLRKDGQWSNGDPVTAQDFYFAWVTQMKPETGSYMASFLFENIKNGEAFYNGQAAEADLGIEVVNDYTLKITWERPMTDGLFLLALPMFFPVNQAAYEEIGAAQYGKDADKMLTNGAYLLTEWVHDDHMLLERSDSYHNAANIKIPKVRLVMIGDTNTRLNAFMTGEIDLCNTYSEQIAQVKEKDADALHSYIDGGSWYIGFNMKNPYLENLNLRKALAYSIDVQSLLDNVIADGSIAADGLVPSSIAGANDEGYADARGSLFAYDLEKAKGYMDSALAELGVSAADIKLTLDVADTSYSQNQAAYIQQQWKQNLGLDVKVNAQSWQAVQEAKGNGNFAISIEAMGPNENTAMTFLELFISDNANNLGKYSNPEYDRLLAEADLEVDLLKKQNLMIQAEKLLLKDMAMGPLYFTCTTYAVSDKLEGLIRTPFQYFNVCAATIRK